MADLHHYLHQLLEHRASDLHLKVGAVPHVRIDGRLTPLIGSALNAAQLESIVDEVVPPEARASLDADGDLDLALGVPGVGRFRVNVHRQRGSFGVVARCVPPGMPSWEQLGLPPAVRRLADADEGLILVAGPAGSGRSTTGSMLVDHVNSTRAVTIITVERPIEVLHPDKRSLVVQREVGVDTPGFVDAINRVLRQDCEVLYVSDASDRQTASSVLQAAASGRLVIAVISGASAVGAIRQFLDLFPEPDQPTVRRALAGVLRGVCVQHLLERRDGLGRVPAVELLVGTNRTADVLQDSMHDLSELDRIIAEGPYHGMQGLQQSLYELCTDKIVAPNVALRLAPAVEDLRLALHRAGLMAS